MGRIISNHLTLKDVLNSWAGDAGKNLATAICMLSEERRIETVCSLLDVYLHQRDDEHAVLMLEALERVVGHNSTPTLSQRLEPLFWRLPDEISFTQSRLWLFGRLILDWTWDITSSDSFYAFRRCIAQMWPQPRRVLRRDGELDVEAGARGRTVVRAEQQGAIEIVRDRLAMNTFVVGIIGSLDADKVFGPWLAQPWVPDDLLVQLIVARAKFGGPALVNRDIRNAQILNGLPDSARTVIGGYTAGMRQIAMQAESALRDVIRRTMVRHPNYDAQTNMKRYFEFSSTDRIEMSIRAEGEHDLADTYADAIMAVEEARKAGQLQICHTVLTVYLSPPGNQLTQYWPKAS